MNLPSRVSAPVVKLWTNRENLHLKITRKWHPAARRHLRIRANTVGLRTCLISDPATRPRTSSRLWYSEPGDQDVALISNRRLRCWDSGFSALGRVQRRLILRVHLCILPLTVSNPPPPLSRRHNRKLPGSASKTRTCFDLSSRPRSHAHIQMHEKLPYHTFSYTKQCTFLTIWPCRLHTRRRLIPLRVHLSPSECYNILTE